MTPSRTPMTPATKAAREAVAAFLEQRFGLPRANYATMAADICALPELRAAFAGEWLPIETMGFGVEEMILVLTAGGHAYTVDADKDMDGAWLVAGSKRRAAKTGEPHGANEIITHWKLLGLLPTTPSEPSNG